MTAQAPISLPPHNPSQEPDPGLSAASLNAPALTSLRSAEIRGIDLLRDPLKNKGTAFSEAERDRFHLHGLLPPQIETLEEQVIRAHKAFEDKKTDLERYIYMRRIQDTNETLFYALLAKHVEEMMPVVYTPGVGEACKHYSTIYRAPRGLYISHPLADRIDEILDNSPIKDPAVIVVTDGERILGLGDQGAGGMGIPIGKLSLYTACGGIDPSRTLPIMLDVGTNNPELLNNPLYLGVQQPRIAGAEYDAFVEKFVRAIERRYPGVLLQWEDFAKSNATRLLARYKDQLCTFNDDIQGTAAVTTGCLLAAVAAAGSRIEDQRVAIVGAGSAGCGIAEQIKSAMLAAGLEPAEASKRFFLVDREGLLRDSQATRYMDFQKPFLQAAADVAAWSLDPAKPFGLSDVIRNAKPTILIGVSGQPDLFSRELVEEMQRHAPRPIIMPLSNPTSQCEAKPADLIAWTGGQAIVATGSPFAPVEHGGKSFPISQCNNSYVFPGLGLGVISSGATRVNDAMLMAAAEALAEASPRTSDPGAPLLPPLSEIQSLSKAIAFKVALTAQATGVAPACPPEVLKEKIGAHFWQAKYS